MATSKSKDAYTVGWIAALPIERAAAAAMLDEPHEKPNDFEKFDGDHNSYSWGRVGAHDVVIASLPAGMYGQASATASAKAMVMSFPIRFGLMVGIGGGIPRLEDELDIRLGDVVVSQPQGNHGGVAQYDIGKATTDGFVVRGFLNTPPIALLNAVAHLQADHEGSESRIPEILKDMLQKNPRMAKAVKGRPSYQHQGQEHDRLFRDDYPHAPSKSCAACDLSGEVRREAREDLNPVIHYGTIASGNVVIKSAADRAEVLRRLGDDCLCVETEAAGLMNNFPCLVVRGICDYADAHKNDRWQRYAAATAAAYAKELLGVLDGSEVGRAKTAAKVLDEVARTVVKTHLLVTETKRTVQASVIERWLAPPDPSTNYNEALRHRHPDSGQWLLQHEKYNAWKTQRISFLWLSGDSGRGKTVLSSAIIQDLKGSLNRQADTVLYFYLSFSDNQKQSLEDILRSLAIQLYHNQPEAQSSLLALHSEYGNGTQRPSLDSLQRTFQQMLRAAGSVYIVIDALDEYKGRTNRRSDLLAWIKGFHEGLGNVRLLVTSRPEDDIKTAFEGWASAGSALSLSADLTGRDIAEYIHAEVTKSKQLSRWHKQPDMQDEIEKALIKKADGVFRWVACQLDRLKDCLDRSSVRKALKSLPKTLDETYTQALNRLNDSWKEKTITLLQFLAYSERPLRIEEATDALAVDLTASLGNSQFDKKARMPVPAEMSLFCSTLIVVVSRTGQKEEEESVTELQLAHSSVKEYLTSRSKTEFEGCFEELTARAIIAKVCLTYLLGLEYMRSIQQLCDSYYLAQFAARYWAEHAAKDNGSSSDVHELAMKLLTTERRIRICYQLYAPDTPWESINEQRRGCYPLYYASSCGLGSCVRSLICREEDVNAQGGKCGNALQAASLLGHLEIVRILLEKGADINAQGGEFNTALQAASFQGHLNIIQLLLENGADINAQGGSSALPFRPLHFKATLMSSNFFSRIALISTPKGGSLTLPFRPLHLKATLTSSEFFSRKALILTPKGGGLVLPFRPLHFKATSTLSEFFFRKVLMLTSKGGILALPFRLLHIQATLILSKSFLRMVLILILKVDYLTVAFILL